MSVDRNSHLVPLAAREKEAANNQLIPYFPAKGRIIPVESHRSGKLSLAGAHASKPYALVIPPPAKWAKYSPYAARSIYNTKRRLVVPKMKRTGLLIDIYA